MKNFNPKKLSKKEMYNTKGGMLYSGWVQGGTASGTYAARNFPKPFVPWPLQIFKEK